MARLKPGTPASVENPAGFQHSRLAHTPARAGMAGQGPARPVGTVRPLKRHQRARTPALTPPHPSLGGPRGARWWSTRGGAQRASRRSTLSSCAASEPLARPPPVRVPHGRLSPRIFGLLRPPFCPPGCGGWPSGHGGMAGRPTKKRGPRRRSAPDFLLPHLADKIALSVAACEVGKTSDCSRGAGNTPGTATILNRTVLACRQPGRFFFDSVRFLPTPHGVRHVAAHEMTRRRRSPPLAHARSHARHQSIPSCPQNPVKGRSPCKRARPLRVHESCKSVTSHTVAAFVRLLRGVAAGLRGGLRRKCDIFGQR